MSCNDNLLRNFRLYISEGLLRRESDQSGAQGFCQKKCGNLCRRNTADKINILYLSGEKIQNRQAFQGPLTEQALPDGSAII